MAKRERTKTDGLPIHGFRAQSYPRGPAVELIWDLAEPAADPDDISVCILRRERRFPGRGRRGNLLVEASPEDLDDGLPVYDSTSFEVDTEETREEREGERLVATTRRYLRRGQPRDRLLVASWSRETAVGGEARRTTVRVLDRCELVAGTIYYYTAFVGPNQHFSRHTQAAALATPGSGHALFHSLPVVHQSLDTTPPEPGRVANADRDKGQLQRLLEVFDAHADMLRGMNEGLRDLHDPRRADSRVLGALAHLIGWKLKDHLDEDGQRNEILFAPELYRTVGTKPNLVAMINRLTGWDAQIRELARSVLVSFDTSRLEKLETGETVYLDGSLAPSEGYLAFLDGLAPSPPSSERWICRQRPAGSVDTNDQVALFKLRTQAFDDPTAYTYDAGTPDGQGGYKRDDKVWYNRETIGVYIVPDLEAETFSFSEEWARVRQILTEFLPIHVVPVFFLQPAMLREVYDTQKVSEESADTGILKQQETYGEGADESSDRIPGWRWFLTNDLGHRTVDTAAVETGSRTWHVGLDQGI